MKVIGLNKKAIDDLSSTLKRIDDSIIRKLAYASLNCENNSFRDDIRKELYKSSYHPHGLENSELILENHLKRIQENNSNICLSNQNKEYKWIEINREKMKRVNIRYYLAPNPNNLHELVKKLTEMFLKRNVPVKYKYQLTTGMHACDRVIIYSDYDNRNRVLDAIKSVYDDNPFLFENCERSLAWLYDTKVPGLYIAPETPGEAYSNVISEAIIEAHDTLCFLYGFNNNINLNSIQKEKTIRYMEAIITSILIRKGLVLSKDDEIIIGQNNFVKEFYDYDKRILRHFCQDSSGYYEVSFLPNSLGRNALLNNFYNVKKVKKQDGVIVRHLTLEERKEEVNRALYPYLYNDDGKIKGK